MWLLVVRRSGAGGWQFWDRAIATMRSCVRSRNCEEGSFCAWRWGASTCANRNFTPRVCNRRARRRQSTKRASSTRGRAIVRSHWDQRWWNKGWVVGWERWVSIWQGGGGRGGGVGSQIALENTVYSFSTFFVGTFSSRDPMTRHVFKNRVCFQK